ncbi:MAG TPA: arsenic resistance N-acetyltransferase ArsN2 [Rhodocyclaceae bacterium]|nr:arsenic resistance N-acetyltransferase ArsN2 [Rhodocyclaceae bacterium]
MRIEPISSIEEVTALLAENTLPIADISVSSPLQFFGIRDGGALVAVVGLEIYQPFGLLRSLAVRSTFRKRGLARELVSFAESWSAAHGVESLFLLTTTADQFFLGLGYSFASRDKAPSSIQATSQFSSLCPASSAFLSKGIALRANTAVQGCCAIKLRGTPGLNVGFSDET